MKFEGENLAAAVRAEAAGASELAAAYAQPQLREKPAGTTLRWIVTQYRAAPNGYLKLAPSTRKHWSRWLDEIDKEFGDLPVKALKARGVKRDFIAWRDSMAATPRSADYAIQVLRRVLSFAVRSDLAEVNPAQDIEGIYDNNRADKIVEDSELAAILKHVPPRAALVIKLAAATGMRRGDLVKLKWTDVTDTSLEFATEKSRGRIRALVPLVTDAKAVIEELRKDRDRVRSADRVPSAYLLTTKHGGPWKEDSVTQAFIRGARAAGVEGRDFHDLRGTAVTRFIVAGLTDTEVADIVGWEPTKVSRIKHRYVDRDRVARAIAARLERTEIGG